MSRVLVTGAHGMLGTAVLLLAPSGVEVVGIDLEDGDLTQPGTAAELLARHRPKVVIHCAAWTDVDGCTRDPQRAMLNNGQATAKVAAACAGVSARLLYLSTDYVFAGDLGRPYVETDEPHPLNPYGESKLAGERAVQQIPGGLVVRTQWLYGPGGKNFVATIVQAARTRDHLRVVADEFGSPTYVRDLAGGLWEAAGSDLVGIIHLTNYGICTWAELAAHAITTAGLQVTIEPISSADWNSPTVRPGYSPLENRRWVQTGRQPLRPWQEAVTEYVSEFLSKTPDSVSSGR